MNIKKVFKEEESFKIFKTFGLSTNIKGYQKIFNHDWREQLK